MIARTPPRVPKLRIDEVALSQLLRREGIHVGRDLGFDLAQGYSYGRPGPANLDGWMLSFTSFAANYNGYSE